MKYVRLAAILVLTLPLTGCVFTKVVSVPMRVVGAAVSIIPVAGNEAHSAIDRAAEAVDDVPI
jgi:hypothetical protein